HAGQGGVPPIARLVAAADRVVCGDTGIAHLATALRTPSVVLFGPTSPALWGPPPHPPWHRALWAGTSGDPPGQLPDPGLLAIDVDQVTAALADLPPAATPGPARRAPLRGRVAPPRGTGPRPPLPPPPPPRPPPRGLLAARPSAAGSPSHAGPGHDPLVRVVGYGGGRLL